PMISAMRRDARVIASMAPTASRVSAPPCSARVRARLASVLAACACAAFCWIVAVICSTAAAVSSSDAACCRAAPLMPWAPPAVPTRPPRHFGRRGPHLPDDLGDVVDERVRPVRELTDLVVAVHVQPPAQIPAAGGQLPELFDERVEGRHDPAGQQQ